MQYGMILQIVIWAMGLAVYFACPVFIGRSKTWIAFIVLILQSLIIVTILQFYFDKTLTGM